MNETRRKEIESIIERLREHQSNLYEIRVADALCHDTPDAIIENAEDYIADAVTELRRAIL